MGSDAEVVVVAQDQTLSHALTLLASQSPGDIMNSLESSKKGNSWGTKSYKKVTLKVAPSPSSGVYSSSVFRTPKINNGEGEGVEGKPARVSCGFPAVFRRS